MYSIKCSLTQESLIAEATDEVIVHQSSRLHVRICDCWPDETKSPLLEILAQCLGFGGGRWNLSRGLPAAEFGLPADEPPAVGVKAAELFLDLEKRTSIAHRGLDLHAVADNLRIYQKAPGLFLGIARDPLGIEAVERPPIAFPLLQHKRPVQSGLRA